MTGAELAASVSAAFPLLQKYGLTTAGMVLNAVGRWRLGRRLSRVEGVLDYLNSRASQFNLPEGFDQQEAFEDFAAAVLEVGLHTTSERKQKILAYFLLNEPAHGQTLVDAKAKVLELLPHLQPQHLELLAKIAESCLGRTMPPPKIQDWDTSLVTLAHVQQPMDRLDLFYSAASDLLRWYLVRSTPETHGVNIAGVADFLPGTRNAAHLLVTQLGHHVLGYIKDPEGHFIDFSALGGEDEERTSVDGGPQ